MYVLRAVDSVARLNACRVTRVLRMMNANYRDDQRCRESRDIGTSRQGTEVLCGEHASQDLMALETT